MRHLFLLLHKLYSVFTNVSMFVFTVASCRRHLHTAEDHRTRLSGREKLYNEEAMLKIWINKEVKWKERRIETLKQMRPLSPFDQYNYSGAAHLGLTEISRPHKTQTNTVSTSGGWWITEAYVTHGIHHQCTGTSLYVCPGTDIWTLFN